jgi:hypothetical protein
MGPLNQCQLGGRTAHGSLSLVVKSPGRRQAPTRMPYSHCHLSAAMSNWSPTSLS